MLTLIHARNPYTRTANGHGVEGANGSGADSDSGFLTLQIARIRFEKNEGRAMAQPLPKRLARRGIR